MSYLRESSNIPDHVKGVNPMKGKFDTKACLIADEEVIPSEDVIQAMKMTGYDAHVINRGSSGINTLYNVDGERRIDGTIMNVVRAKRVNTKPSPTSQQIASHILIGPKMKQSRPLRRR